MYNNNKNNSKFILDEIRYLYDYKLSYVLF